MMISVGQKKEKERRPIARGDAMFSKGQPGFFSINAAGGLGQKGVNRDRVKMKKS